MKKASEVLNLKLIGIKEGAEAGVVQDIMVNAATKSVEYLILKSMSGYGIRTISISDVVGIGADYIITSTADNVKKLYESKELMETVEKGFFMLGSTVLSSTGDIIGSVTDFSFDVKGGKIISMLLNNGGEFAEDKIISLAGSTVFINNEGTFVNTAKVSKMDEESRKFLLGKTMNSDVTSDDGGFKVEKGTVLTEAILDEAAKHDALLILTLNV